MPAGQGRSYPQTDPHEVSGRTAFTYTKSQFVVLNIGIALIWLTWGLILGHLFW